MRVRVHVRIRVSVRDRADRLRASVTCQGTSEAARARDAALIASTTGLLSPSAVCRVIATLD